MIHPPISMSGAMLVVALAVAILSLALDISLRLHVMEREGEING